jgi:hypothetical protein
MRRFLHLTAIFLFPVLIACGDDDTAGTGGGGTTSTGGSGGTISTGGGGGNGGSAVMPVTVVVPNFGDSSLEGHTPRGFMGQGTGLFAGDNLNPNFPEGDGVQIFLTFDLSQVPAGTVESATLRSSNASVSGTPFQDLGALEAEEIRFDAFSSALWNAEPETTGNGCLFASDSSGPYSCDIAAIVQRSLDEGYAYAQVRLRLETAGDGDGAQDLVMFFITDSNTNEPGIFELEVNVTPSG